MSAVVEEVAAGRELDALIAERVMGLASHHGHFWYRDFAGNEIACQLPAYSTDISEAWEVLENMRERLADDDGLETWGRFCEELNINFDYAVSKLRAYLKPVDICRAALRAVQPKLSEVVTGAESAPTTETNP